MRYWDVEPRQIKVSKSATNRSVALNISGGLAGALSFTSTDSSIAAVDTNGVLSLGTKVGAAMITARDAGSGAEPASLRHVQVEVIDEQEALACWLPWEES